jgi:hypothetical protein
MEDGSWSKKRAPRSDLMIDDASVRGRHRRLARDFESRHGHGFGARSLLGGRVQDARRSRAYANGARRCIGNANDRHAASRRCDLVGWRPEVSMRPASVVPLGANAWTSCQCVARDADHQPYERVGWLRWCGSRVVDRAGGRRREVRQPPQRRYLKTPGARCKKALDGGRARDVPAESQARRGEKRPLGVQDKGAAS